MTAESGQASVEYTALLLLVAMLLAGIVAAGMAPPEPPTWLVGAMRRAWKAGPAREAPTGRSSGSRGADEGRAWSPRPARLAPLIDRSSAVAGITPVSSAPGGRTLAVARRFARLSPAEGRNLARRHPHRIGRLDGAPPVLRYQANRILIRRARTRLGARYGDSTKRSCGGAGGWRTATTVRGKA